jgi:hypothetical protein
MLPDLKMEEGSQELEKLRKWVLSEPPERKEPADISISAW